MEITLTIDGKEKVFVQNTVNIKTMRMAIEWSERTQEQQEFLIQLSENIDEIGDLEEYKKKFKYSDTLMDGLIDIEMLTNLVVTFFNGQFTHDQFINGAYFHSLVEFYQLGHDIFALVANQKNETEEESKKKDRMRQRNRIS